MHNSPLYFLHRMFFNIIRLSFFLLAGIIFFSCSQVSSEEVSSSTGSESFWESIKSSLGIAPASLTISQYLQWLKEQKGITYDSQENSERKISIQYKPLVLEAAISAVQENYNRPPLEKHMEIKKAYHHLLLECLEKTPSVSNASRNQQQLFTQLKNNFYIIKNESDTIRNLIVEVFPSNIMNQPHQLLVMVPADIVVTTLQAGLIGKPFGLKDLRIAISKNQIKSFPEIKL